MTSTDNGFVMVPVPTTRVHEVYFLLGSPPGSTLPAESAAGGADRWTEALLRRLYNESADNARQLLRCLAEADGAEISTNEIAEQLELPKGASSVAGMTGAIGRRVANRYKMDGVPWNARWHHIDPTDPTKGTETMMSLPKWMCEVIKAL